MTMGDDILNKKKIIMNWDPLFESPSFEAELELLKRGYNINTLSPVKLEHFGCDPIDAEVSDFFLDRYDEQCRVKTNGEIDECMAILLNLESSFELTLSDSTIIFLSDTGEIP
jgi:hypothetical protein